MQKIKKIISGVLMLAPAIVSAATIGDILSTVDGIIKTLLPMLIGVAVLVFIWGVIKYITAGADEDKRTEARNTILYGVIGLFAIVAVWGLVNVLASTFGIETGGPVNIPQLP